MSLARTICDDLKENAERFCCTGCCTFRCCGSGCWTVKGCIASVIAVILPVTFTIQLVAMLIGYWVFSDNYQVGCLELSGGMCVLEILAVTLEGFLMFFGVCICSQTSSSHIDVRACRFCYVCFMPVIALIPGILSVYCCIVTVMFVNKNNKPDINYTYGPSFYMFLVTGCTLIAVSLAAVCGYVCVKYRDSQFDIGSDDADTTPILPARQS